MIMMMVGKTWGIQGGHIWTHCPHTPPGQGQQFRGGDRDDHDGGREDIGYSEGGYIWTHCPHTLSRSGTVVIVMVVVVVMIGMAFIVQNFEHR